MKKLLINEKMGDYEIENKKASYKTLVHTFIDDLVLCNNVIDIDDELFYNVEVGTIEEDTEIYQYYVCDINKWTIETLKELTGDNNDIIICYSNILDCDVLCVNHYGTGWDYVSTSVELTENIEECEI